jgi:4-amino-4-deoxy-L-arabinose transferase-like glycosyltransferase
MVLHLWGIRKNLPYEPESDESIFVEGAVHMVASGNLNPGWFGNPGSTIFYPLAGTIHAWRVIAHGAPLFQSNPELVALFDRNIYPFYLLGRFLSVIYGVLSVPLIFLLGKNAFNAQTGLLGAFLFIFYPLSVSHAQMVRTDSAGTFFGLLSLWLCLRAYDRPMLLNHILAGIAIGLSVSSRYFMVLLVPFLLLLDFTLLHKHYVEATPRQLIIAGIAGVVVAFIAFVLSTPFFFLDFSTVVENLRLEARMTHLGADGLSRSGNFIWYLFSVIPAAISWPQAILAVIGAIVAILKRHFKPAALLVFSILYLVGISLSPLHWQRWIIQILPVLSLFVASAIILISDRLIIFLRLPREWLGVLMFLGMMAFSAQPGYQTILEDIQQSRPSTRLLARQWILEHLPPHSKVAQDAYGAFLSGTDFQVDQQFSLAADRDLGDYYREGYQYLVVSSSIYNRYFAEPERYSREVDFYQALFHQAELLRQFEPSKKKGGPIIRVYRLQTAP